MKTMWMLLCVCFAAGSSSLVRAVDFKRFELQPFGGFTASGSIPLVSDDDVHRGSIHVDSSFNYGANFAINLNSLDAVEAHWQRQSTEGRLPAEFISPVSSGSPPSFNLKIDQIHCNFLHHYQVADPRAMPYVMAGLGATTYSVSRNAVSDSRAYFSFALGGGIKYLLTNHLGLRGEARWSPTLVSASDSSFWCNVGGSGATCVVQLKASLQHQLDLTAGIVIRF
jgi:opacity protein-like surface antigen